MKIETRFNKGDKVFLLNNKKVCDSIVRGFDIRIMESTTITLLCNTDPDQKVNLKIDQEDAFPSKEDLLKSL